MSTTLLKRIKNISLVCIACAYVGAKRLIRQPILLIDTQQRITKVSHHMKGILAKNFKLIT